MTVAIQTCTRCSADLPYRAHFCPRCGATTPTTFTGAPDIDSGDASDARAVRAARERLQAALGSSYEVGERIGVGGFAEVFAAYDTTLKREVAVKTLRVELTASAVFLDRFRREAEAVARLRHPHIISIYAVGLENRTAFFVMPRITGTTLADALDAEQHWSIAEVCRVLREASSALAEAHRNGLVHRDVKPENIMLDGPERRIVIMDFGIAKTTDSESPSLTATGATIGSPRYMSPEQALGEMPIDHLSDQYSLALVGYRMLAGRLPFEGDSARHILLQKATRAPTPVRELRPDVPSTLARIIERALSKEREARFPSMAEFGSALAGVVAEVTGEFRQRRVVAPMADRWSIARASLYDRPLRYVSVAAMALAAFVVAYPRAGSSAARSAAGARDTALSATRAIMAELGAPGDYAERIQFIARETEHRYIQSALSADSAERVAKQLPIWIWDVTRYRRDPLDAWRIEANGAGRIMAFTHLLPDTAHRPMIAQDSALSIAERELERLGWRLTDLRLVRHSTPTEANRVQENFVWTVAGSTIHRARDSAYTQLSLTLAGPEPVAYRQSLRLPDGYVPNLRPQTIQALASIGMTGLLVLVIIAVITTMLRSAHDVLQWGLGVRMGAIAGALWVLSVTLPRLRGVTVPYSPDDVSRVARGLNYVLASMLNVSMMGSVLVVAFLFVAAESLLNEGRPDLLAGINDLSRGRLAIPEVVGALPAGYAYGFVAAAFLAVVQLIQRNVFDVPVETELVNNAGAFANAVPALGLLEPLRIAIVAIAVVMFVIALALQWRRPWIAPIAVSLLWYCVRFGPSESSPAHVAAEAVVLGAVTWLAWERGALVALMVMFLAVAVPVVADLLWARGPFVSSGIVGLIVVAAPAAFGAAVYRRRSAATRPVGVRVR